ncbi:hypothetical protein J3R82DRAFT_6876 [Butyriboletus roseoflavus]|nr:hypothetical protein J3R82DRAFT_6876 [Butyriboletus roseoflavus]
MAIKSKQKPSGSQESPTPRNASPSPKAELQPSSGKEKKAKSRSSSLESAAEKNLRAMESMKRFSKICGDTLRPASNVPLTHKIHVCAKEILVCTSLDSLSMCRHQGLRDTAVLWYAIKHNYEQLDEEFVQVCFYALLAPLRQVVLHTYRKVNTSIARGREDTVKEFTSGRFQEKTIKAMRRREKGQTWSWTITSDVSDAALFPKSKTPTPVDIVSIRAGEVYTENAEPINGHRLLIQALVKFDTTQRIDITDKRGESIKSDLAGSRKVVQYLLLEKMGWYDTPWKIKDQYHKA